MNSPCPPKLDQHLCFALYSTSLKLTQIYKPLLEKLNLTYPQYLVMVVLWEQEGLGIKDLAEKLQQDSGSITPVVQRLEAEGYLNRTRDPDDQRSLILTLTEAGKALKADAYQINQSIKHACASCDEEIAGLMNSLVDLRKKLAS
ncbi:MarR family winged helix-turn-helix transcriptional regulator [Chitinimonas naiadis]